MTDILLVDDDPDILEALQWFLSDEGIGVRAASTMAQVDTILDQDPLPAAILLDLFLSGSDGRGICERIRNNQRTKDLPVILMSAHPSGSSVAQACGATGFISKPFDLDDILSSLARYIPIELTQAAEATA